MKPRDFQNERQRLTELTLSKANLEIKRFFAMDHAAYQDGALDVKTKEMLGLVASMVLRCDDCIRYHLDQCRQCGITDAELNEIFNIALVVGGSNVIPHLRRAVEYWEAGKEPTIS